MAILVVGGHTRNIGKTSVVAGLIAATKELNWTAIKITQFGHGVCSANGGPCGCETAEHTIAISEERDRTSTTDTARFLAAGAARSIWVRTRQGQLAAAMPRIRQLLASAENAVIESNSVLRFLQPDLSLSVLDPAVSDFKPSALRYLDRVDALIVPQGRWPEGALCAPAWQGVSLRLLEGRRRFGFQPPVYCSPELVAFIQARIAAGRCRASEPAATTT
jgi:molybdopterin-guanine dinucleotide biosynthesis protein